MPKNRKLAMRVLLDLKIELYYQRLLDELDNLMTALSEAYGESAPNVEDIPQVIDFVEHRKPLSKSSSC